MRHAPTPTTHLLHKVGGASLLTDDIVGLVKAQARKPIVEASVLLAVEEHLLHEPLHDGVDGWHVVSLDLMRRHRARAPHVP